MLTIPAPAAVAAGHVAAAPGPVIVAVSASPNVIPSAGGTVSISVRVQNASTCTIRGQSGPFASLDLSQTVSCASGHAKVAVPLGANRYQHPFDIQYYVRASGSNGRRVQQAVYVHEAAFAPPASVPRPAPQSPTVAALAISATGLPTATAGVPYSASLLGTGGTAPYSWSLVSGSLPTGLTLSTSGAITGTPTALGLASFAVQVTDSTAPAAENATATLSIDVVSPATPVDRNDNWSGYIESGGPFTVVAGTFTVPNLVATPGTTTTSEWVGIDGYSNTALIQAGVTEAYNPATNLVHLHAWWEILPDVETPISLALATGNQVTVTIGQVMPGTWAIKVTNDSTGQSFSTLQSYAGAGTSAEWIVEAPTSVVTGQDTLGNYTPNVTFTSLGITGMATQLTEAIMVQSGIVVSTPSSLTSNGFTVAYGGAVPSAP